MGTCDSKYRGCLYYSANALSRAISKLADEEFAKIGLQSTTYAFLLMVVNEHPGIQPKEISEKLQLTQSTVTRLIEKMEFRGLLERTHEGRNTIVVPTKECKKMDAPIKEAWNNFHTKYESLIGKKQSEELAAKNFEAYSKLK